MITSWLSRRSPNDIAQILVLFISLVLVWGFVIECPSILNNGLHECSKDIPKIAYQLLLIFGTALLGAILGFSVSDRYRNKNAIKCTQCGNKILPMLHDGKIAEYKMNTTPELPPFNLFICTNCGYWSIFSLALRGTPKQIPKDQLPEQVKNTKS